jgi:hypothetical protein
VLVEATVFDGEHRLLHHRRDLRERHAPALLAAVAVDGGDERRLDGDRLDRATPLHLEPEQLRALWRRARLAGVGAKHRANRLRVPLPAARDQRDARLADGELARLLGTRPFRVAEIVQPLDELSGRERLPTSQLERPREDLRLHACDAALEPRVHHAREPDVGVSDDSRKRDQHYERKTKEHPANAAEPACSSCWW